jgi:hypothetical protein
MLFKGAELEAIRSGKVSLAFRRWRRPTVKAGGTLMTPIGLLSIDRVTIVDASDISSIDAASSGYDLDSLLSDLNSREGNCYRIDFQFIGPDPRVALRENANLSDEEIGNTKKKLLRLDSASKAGAWTLEVLCAIQAKPRLAAAQLAEQTGFEKDWLKSNIRKLKNLGLTISHQPGYVAEPTFLVHFL